MVISKIMTSMIDSDDVENDDDDVTIFINSDVWISHDELRFRRRGMVVMMLMRRSMWRRRTTTMVVMWILYKMIMQSDEWW